MVKRWPDYFSAHHNTVPFLRSLNSVIHPEVRKLYSGAYCPHFDFTSHQDGSLLIGYRSPRRLCGLAHGFILGAGDHYGETLTVRHLECMRAGDDRCLVAVSTSDGGDDADSPRVELICALSVENARLRRRLDREVRIRKKAEEIAEDGLRDLYRKQCELEFLSQITIMANRGGSPQDVLQSALEYMCRFTGWSAAHAYIVAGEGATQRMWPSNIWYCAPELDLSDFQTATAGYVFGEGERLPGLALGDRFPGLGREESCMKSGDFARREAALAGVGLRAAFSVPLLIGPDVVAALEFFGAAPDAGGPQPDAGDPAGQRSAGPGDRARSRQRPAARPVARLPDRLAQPARISCARSTRRSASSRWPSEAASAWCSSTWTASSWSTTAWGTRREMP